MNAQQTIKQEKSEPQYSDVVRFIREKFPSGDYIQLHEPSFIGNEKKYVLETIDSANVSSVGPFVTRLEEEVSRYTNTKSAVAVVNGTVGLQVALQLAGVKQGDEVITQALTFIATANSIVYNGATPIFLDVDRDTMGLSKDSLLEFLENNVEKRENGAYNKRTGRKISCCLPMHTFGFMTQIEEIVSICNSWQIPVIEDAAEALGSNYNGKQAGSFGLMSVFSFNGNKIVTSGGGGMIVTNDMQLGKDGRHLTSTAKENHPWEYNYNRIGYNFRMPNINAALACAQLENLNLFLQSKKELANEYQEYFNRIGINFRVAPKNSTTNNWLMCLEMESKQERDAFLKFTNSNGVMTRPIWKLMTNLPMYQDCFHDELVNSRYFEERIVNIPSGAGF